MTEALRQKTVWNDTLETVFSQVEQELLKNEEHKTLAKLHELRGKIQREQLNIGFCGHFSAGKSSLMNHLLGLDLLPTSPIPTSANLVLIRKGKSGASIHFTDGRTRQIPLEDMQHWKAYCLDGETVERVEMAHEGLLLLEEGVQLLDTPGVDSTDPAHQQATENALHLADVIFFVTDYNHVQSEQNFDFLKKLKDQGKMVILIVNQIDKHRARELSLTMFLQRIKSGLKEWGAEPDALLFTTLKVEDHPYNQLPALLELCSALFRQKKELILHHGFRSLSTLLDEYAHSMLRREEHALEETKQRIEALKQEANWAEAPALLTEYRQSEQRVSAWMHTVEEQTDKLIEQAILTPYETTKLAQAYIESRQDQFKVGLLFSRAKTQAERTKRLEALHHDVNERIRAQVDWHVKEMVKRLAGQFGIQDEAFQQQLLDIQVELDEEWLKDNVKQGTVSSEYVYQYTKEMKGAVRKRYGSALFPVLQYGEKQLRNRHQAQYAPLQERLNQYRQIERLERDVEQALENVRTSMADMKQRLIAQFPETNPIVLPSVEPLGEACPGVKSVHRLQAAETSVRQEANGHQVSVGLDTINEWVGRLEAARQALQAVPVFRHLITRLEGPLEHLRSKRFKTCVFGAFSAGKSSFINALIGEEILPVSPNPTTAAINRLCPVDHEHPHGTIVVNVKSEEQILAEIRIAADRLQLKRKEDVRQQLEQVDAVDPQALRSSLKPYYTFLSACRKGWSGIQDQLGQERVVDFQSFQAYVAEESVACFVQQVDIYHRNAYTDAGIELIDTPGADSIYARHTNVTFEYVKHADVMIYLTYYNHAFSRADRTFLDQLGRVKDQFALDKMFFLVNAADLAASADELQSVLEHVEQNLLQSGIRQPRIFPVSSIRVLENGFDAGMNNFTQQFCRFLANDLAQMSTHSARRELEQALVHLQDLSDRFQSFQREREQTLHLLQQREANLIDRFQAASWPTVKQEIEQEVQEQGYYIKQRLLYNFSQHFNEAFHPSVLSTADQPKRKMDECLSELLFHLLFHLQEEWRAASLRLETFVVCKQELRAEQWVNESGQEGIVLTGADVQSVPFDLPPLPSQLAAERLPNVQPYFKSAKSFFEQGGKDKLKADLEESMKTVIEQYVREAVERYIFYYTERWEQIEDALRTGFCHELQQVMLVQTRAFSGEVTEEQINRVRDQLHDLTRL